MSQDTTGIAAPTDEFRLRTNVPYGERSLGQLTHSKIGLTYSTIGRWPSAKGKGWLSAVGPDAAAINYHRLGEYPRE